MTVPTRQGHEPSDAPSSRVAEDSRDRHPEQSSTAGSTSTSFSFKLIAAWLVVAGAGVLVVGGIVVAYRSTPTAWVIEIIRVHFAAIVGLPAAAIAALFIVLILEHIAGTVEFEGFGFKFRGAAGPVILWLFCFLAIASSIRLVWGLESGVTIGTVKTGGGQAP
jgi:hypothetical protein